MNTAMTLHSRRRPQGMTLVELLIAFAILMGGMVCVFAMILAGTSSHRRAIKETESSIIAGSVLADLRGEFAAGNVPKGDGLTYVDLKDHPGYQINRVIFCIDPKTSPMREYFVRVRVRWSEKGDNQFIEFNTVMLNPTPKK